MTLRKRENEYPIFSQDQTGCEKGITVRGPSSSQILASVSLCKIEWGEKKEGGPRREERWACTWVMSTCLWVRGGSVWGKEFQAEERMPEDLGADFNFGGTHTEENGVVGELKQ